MHASRFGGIWPWIGGAAIYGLGVSAVRDGIDAFEYTKQARAKMRASKEGTVEAHGEFGFLTTSSYDDFLEWVHQNPTFVPWMKRQPIDFTWTRELRTLQTPAQWDALPNERRKDVFRGLQRLERDYPHGAVLVRRILREAGVGGYDALAHGDGDRPAPPAPRQAGLPYYSPDKNAQLLALIRSLEAQLGGGQAGRPSAPAFPRSRPARPAPPTPRAVQHPLSPSQIQPNVTAPSPHPGPPSLQQVAGVAHATVDAANAIGGLLSSL